MTAKLIKKKIISYEYQVVDNYGISHTFSNKADADIYLSSCKREQKILNYLKPKGVTLVVSKNPNVYYKCVAAFIGYNGVPFCSVYKSKDRHLYYNGINSIEDHFSSIHGDLAEVLKKAYALLNGRGAIDRYDGAYHYYWNPAVGNDYCVEPEPEHWKNGVYWYNWDGKEFTTNDKKCKLTTKDFML